MGCEMLVEKCEGSGLFKTSPDSARLEVAVGASLPRSRVSLDFGAGPPLSEETNQSSKTCVPSVLRVTCSIILTTCNMMSL